MSKKASEAERYDRKRKMEREAEAEKRKNNILKKKSSKPKMTQYYCSKGHFRYDEEEYDLY
ncbi:hypothetical protein [Clostridium sp. MD294]|uniref:hypothetical protein n=1 Tax=Clostridium sp. MD294 TaxID=97138 RepID=UPI0002C924EB|nr:hypothetical protein [Clostridium sp. MD294]NDO46452.1 hypothetical protein [Clostridium sp. MD294]USF29118.1 hypothetical protein C820_000501 [Clostridium sp. MD294]